MDALRSLVAGLLLCTGAGWSQTQPTVDPSDPLAVVRAFLNAWRVEDWATMQGLSHSDSAREFNTLIQNGRSSPAYSQLTSGPFWQGLQSWDGTLEPARFAENADGSAAIVRFAERHEAGQSAVLALSLGLENGGWRVWGPHTLSLEEYSSYPLWQPTAQPVATAAVSVDQSDPVAVARAVLESIRSGDVDTLHALCVRELPDTVRTRRPDDAANFEPPTRSQIAEYMRECQSHPSVATWSGELMPPRYTDHFGIPVARIGYGQGTASWGEEVVYNVAVDLINGRWCWEDVHTGGTSLAEWSSFATSMASDASGLGDEPAVIDRTSARAVARAALVAYRDRDLAGLVAVANATNRALLGEIERQGSSHPRYASIFGGARWAAVQGWDGQLTVVHRRQSGGRQEALVPFYWHESPGPADVVVLTLEDGAWGFEDVATIPRDELSALPAE